MVNAFEVPLDEEERDLASSVNVLVDSCFNASQTAGWWNNPETNERIDPDAVTPTKLCLVHSEISEALEGHRKSKMDDHLPHRQSFEVELADAVIRICDLAGAHGLDLGGALVEKMRYNAKRADHKVDHRAGVGGKKY